jgi:tRNA pseudouridine38-40 synthase
MNYRLLIQYDGTKYNGWQRQKNNHNTIQGKIENVLSRLMDGPVEIIGASRTDGGVHGRGQVANVHLEGMISPEDLQEYLNKFLPEDIEITEVKIVSDNFHSRYNAGNKTYSYTIAMNNRKQVFNRKYIYHLGQRLDVEKMKEGAKLLEGEHNFQGFCAKKMNKSTVRTIVKIDFTVEDDVLIITYVGSGFLYQMIRIITGTLIEIGLGTRQTASVTSVLAKRVRAEAGYLAPAKGLCLEKIEYN